MNLKQPKYEFLPTLLSKNPKKEKKEDEKKKLKQKWWERLWSKRKLDKPQTIAILYLRNNGKAEPLEVETRNGFFAVHGKTYNEDRDCVYFMGKERIPLCIVPEWSLVPYGTKQWHDKDLLTKFSELQDHALKGIRHAEIVKMGGLEGKTKWNIKAIIGVGIMVIIGWALLNHFM
jgi:hypothetical protein